MMDAQNAPSCSPWLTTPTDSDLTIRRLLARWRHGDRPRRVVKRNRTPFVDRRASRSASYGSQPRRDGASMP